MEVWKSAPHHMTVDLRHFRSFVVVAEERHVGRAAARLFITQPALSRQLQQLEQHLGVALLDRGPRGVELTDAGRELLEKARIALEAAEDALTIGRPAEPTGRLAVGLAVAGHRDRWYGLAAAFAERHPQVDVELHTALSELLQRQVADGVLDVAIALEPSRRAGLRHDVVREEEVAVWVLPGHPLADRPEVTPADVAPFPVTLIGGAAGRGSGFNDAVRRVFADADLQPAYREPPDLIPINAARDAAFVGVSIDVGYGPEVRRVPLAGGHRMRYALVRRAGGDSPAVRAFAAFATRHAAGA
jgi:DNA-binding transcriptional LysR family regulator